MLVNARPPRYSRGRAIPSACPPMPLSSAPPSRRGCASRSTASSSAACCSRWARVAIVLYLLSRTASPGASPSSQARNLAASAACACTCTASSTWRPGPYIFAPNHQSHFDIAALLGYLPGINRFAAKKELFAEPVLGTVLRTMGMIPIDRDNPLEAIERLQRADARRRLADHLSRGHAQPRRRAAAVQEGRLRRGDPPRRADRAGGLQGHDAVMPKAATCRSCPGDGELSSSTRSRPPA